MNLGKIKFSTEILVKVPQPAEWAVYCFISRSRFHCLTPLWCKHFCIWGVKFLPVLLLGVMCWARMYLIISVECQVKHVHFILCLSFFLLFFLSYICSVIQFFSIPWLCWPRECWSHWTLNLKMTTFLINVNFLIYIHICTLKQSGICIILSWARLLPIIAV